MLLKRNPIFRLNLTARIIIPKYFDLESENFSVRSLRKTKEDELCNKCVNISPFIVQALKISFS